ncbi:hypothetical protein PF003_g13539 [Phytophthora fragariae]|nr:hypothetical protein PF003_g13539 [Phytophthora fragariae]
MVTPRSASRTARLAREIEASNSEQPTRRGSGKRPGWRLSGGDDSSDDGRDLLDFGNDGDGLATEFAQQMREASGMESMNVTPRLEIATHRPLAQIKPYAGLRDKQENSMQWLRAFVYEMKGTHTPPNEWCMAFELSLRDGALHWFRQLPRKTKRDWKLLNAEFIKYYCSQFNESSKTRYYSAQRTDKEHICDYLNRLNGYARNAGIRFANSGREARDHVRRFLKTCGDKSLQKRLGHLQVSDIHELEGMINEILKMEDRSLNKDTPQQPQRSRDSSRGRDNYRRRDETRDGYRRDRRDRDYNRRRDDQRNPPRVALAEASLTDLIAELNIRETRSEHADRSSSHHRGVSEDEFDSESERSFKSDDRDSEDSDIEGRHLAAANENERRTAAAGTFGRSDNRPPRGDRPERSHSRDDRYPRDRRDGGRQHGPCAACGGLNHSAHYCFKRCKLCKQVHEAGKCEAFQELTNLVKSKIDKKDLSPELQNLVFGHLN